MLGVVIISGIATGLLYSLIGVGLVVVYRTTRVLNFAQGDLVTLIAYFTFSMLTMAGAGYAPTAVATLVVGCVLGIAFYYLIVKPLSRRQSGWLRIQGIHDERASINVLIGTLAASMVFQGIEPMVWGYSLETFQSPFPGGSVRFLGLIASYANLGTIGVCAAVLILFGIFFKATSLGKMMNATYDNPVGAELVGVRADRVYATCWAICGLLSAIAALLVTPVVYLTNTSLLVFLFSAFAAVVIGGFTSFAGAIVGGIIFGVTQNLVSVFLSPKLEHAFVSLMIIAILLIRPNGLLGTPERSQRV